MGRASVLLALGVQTRPTGRATADGDRAQGPFMVVMHSLPGGQERFPFHTCRAEFPHRCRSPPACNTPIPTHSQPGEAHPLILAPPGAVTQPEGTPRCGGHGGTGAGKILDAPCQMELF